MPSDYREVVDIDELRDLGGVSTTGNIFPYTFPFYFHGAVPVVWVRTLEDNVTLRDGG